jgi:hypothetical protein
MPVAIVRDQLADTAVIEQTIGDTDLVARPGQARPPPWTTPASPAAATSAPSGCSSPNPAVSG